MLRDYYPRPPDCSDQVENAGYKPVSMVYVYTAYILLILGYLIAVLIFGMEVLHRAFLRPGNLSFSGALSKSKKF